MLPSLFWDGTPETASALRDAHIDSISVPAANVDAWRNVPGITATAGDPTHAVKLLPPGVKYFTAEASATEAPYIQSNGWRYLRNPDAAFFVNAPGPNAALAAAEGYVFGAAPLIQSDSDGLASLSEMLAFLKTLPEDRLPALTDVGFIDDGSHASAEDMNLMIVRNLLFRRLTVPDLGLKIVIRPGSSDYPEAAWQNPDLLEHIIRSQVTDEKRLVRIYGTEVVVARLEGDGSNLVVHLLNYAAAERGVHGVRVRVLGKYAACQVYAPGVKYPKLADFSSTDEATEFTLPELKAYTVVALSRFPVHQTER